jgi:hypothetical protein
MRRHLVVVVLHLVLGTSCAAVRPCVCAPAPDPRVRDLQDEVDRGQAEISRLRDRLRANEEAEREPAPVWISPRIQPEKP